MIIRRKEIPFENPMRRTQSILGWIYLPVHVFLLPWLLRLYQSYSPDGLTDGAANLLYYGAGVVFCLTVMYSVLRGGFDVLADAPLRCLGVMLTGFLMDYALSGAAALVTMLLPAAAENSNTEQILAAAQSDRGAIKAVTIFLVPIVEEMLFRGVVFGSVRGRSRLWAFIVSTAAFSVYHVWSYVAADPAAWVYLVQYLPISIVLAWIYERSGTIWTSIFFHMGINAMSFYVLNALEQL